MICIGGSYRRRSNLFNPRQLNGSSPSKETWEKKCISCAARAWAKRQIKRADHLNYANGDAVFLMSHTDVFISRIGRSAVVFFDYSLWKKKCSHRTRKQVQSEYNLGKEMKRKEVNLTAKISCSYPGDATNDIIWIEFSSTQNVQEYRKIMTMCQKRRPRRVWHDAADSTYGWNVFLKLIFYGICVCCAPIYTYF